MAKPQFSFQKFLDENSLVPKDIINAGFNKNTPALWKKLTTDEEIQQASILKLVKAFPNIDLSKYFPTHRQILELSKNKTNIKK